MAGAKLGGYVGTLLWVDLSSGEITRRTMEESILRQFIGGTGLGVKILYDEVPPGIEWNDPQNRIIFATGPLNATGIMGSATFSVVSKGPLTNGTTSTQASGFMGAYMKFSGFDAVIIHGSASRWSYLYLHDGIAELRDASHLAGKGTRETADLIKKELGKGRRDVSAFAIGPAGENLVRFAAIVGDEGHVAAHNGVGAVMGSKKLKAIVAAREPASKIEIVDKEKLSILKKQVFDSLKDTEPYRQYYEWGTSTGYPLFAHIRTLPVKNYTTNRIPDNVDKCQGPYYRPRFEAKPNPCWACRMHHCHTLKVTEGPYAGYVGEEPEYEHWAGWCSEIGQDDLGAVVVITNEVDDLGMDTNEASWVMGMVIECYERGILTKKDTDGLEMTWGNVEAVRAMLRKIACRQGIGDKLAEGTKRAAIAIGGEAPNTGVYTERGTTPRGHDDRANWLWLFDNCTSSTSVTETVTGADPVNRNYNPYIDLLSPTEVPALLVARKGIVQFQDSLVLCLHCSGSYLDPLVEMVKATTGWDLTTPEAQEIGLRIATLMRAFNLRHGIPASLDAPSPRYGSTPVDGPAQGKSIMPHLPQMLQTYYEKLGWDKETGKPLPQTLARLKLESVAKDLWE